MFGTIDSTPRCAATALSHRLCDGYILGDLRNLTMLLHCVL
jgi:hypothetical protein